MKGFAVANSQLASQVTIAAFPKNLRIVQNLKIANQKLSMKNTQFSKNLFKTKKL